MKKLVLSLTVLVTFSMPTQAIEIKTWNIVADAYNACYSKENYADFKYCASDYLANKAGKASVGKFDLPTKTVLSADPSLRSKYDRDNNEIDVLEQYGKNIASAASYCAAPANQLRYGKEITGECLALYMTGLTRNPNEVAKEMKKDSVWDEDLQNLHDKVKTANDYILPTFVYDSYNTCLSTAQNTHAFFACTINKINAFNGDFGFDVYQLKDKKLYSKIAATSIKNGDALVKTTYFSPKGTFLGLVDKTHNACVVASNSDKEKYLTCFKEKSQDWKYYETLFAGRGKDGRVRYLDSPFK